MVKSVFNSPRLAAGFGDLEYKAEDGEQMNSPEFEIRRPVFEGKKFFLHKSIRNSRKNLKRKIETNGGEVCDTDVGVDFVLVDTARPQVELRMLQLTYSCSPDASKSNVRVEHFTFINRCINSNKIKIDPPRFMRLGGHASGDKGRSAFTEQDKAHLAHYIWRRIPHKEFGGRLGDNIYEELYALSENNGYEWAARHPPQSWKEHYKKNQEYFDNEIKILLATQGEPPVNGLHDRRRMKPVIKNRFRVQDVSDSEEEVVDVEDELESETPDDMISRDEVLEGSPINVQQKAQQVAIQPRKRRRLAEIDDKLRLEHEEAMTERQREKQPAKELSPEVEVVSRKLSHDTYIELFGPSQPENTQIQGGGDTNFTADDLPEVSYVPQSSQQTMINTQVRAPTAETLPRALQPTALSQDQETPPSGHSRSRLVNQLDNTNKILRQRAAVYYTPDPKDTPESSSSSLSPSAQSRPRLPTPSTPYHPREDKGPVINLDHPNIEVSSTSASGDSMDDEQEVAKIFEVDGVPGEEFPSNRRMGSEILAGLRASTMGAMSSKIRKTSGPKTPFGIDSRPTPRSPGWSPPFPSQGTRAQQLREEADRFGKASPYKAPKGTRAARM